MVMALCARSGPVWSLQMTTANSCKLYWALLPIGVILVLKISSTATRTARGARAIWRISSWVNRPGWVSTSSTTSASAVLSCAVTAAKKSLITNNVLSPPLGFFVDFAHQAITKAQVLPGGYHHLLYLHKLAAHFKL